VKLLTSLVAILFTLAVVSAANAVVQVDAVVSTTQVTATTVDVGGVLNMRNTNGNINFPTNTGQLTANGSSKMTVKSASVCIGNACPNIANYPGSAYVNGTLWVSSTASSPVPTLATTTSGNVGIGTATPDSSLTVVGGISATGVIKPGSPTAIPSCSGAAAGAIFMNTTTHCLMYCNGTSATTLNSTASGC
jgi:hypothetical protein